LDIDDIRLRSDRGPVFFGQIEVILIKAVLGIMPAANHATPAMRATGPLGTGATEIGIGNRLALLAKKDTHSRGLEGGLPV
jgi:hypothetical protein